MEEPIKPTKTVFSVSQFLDWQRQGTLNLNPIFQRRPVWKRPAKSQLIDSLVRGYPLPIILLRQVQDIDTLSMRMEVVDGQQRLRTLLSFIDPNCLPDYDEKSDGFTVRRIHNSEISGKRFHKLDRTVRENLLGYELSTHIFPATTGDELVYRIFARLNSTGLSLNKQEIRNAEFHGAFKSLVYELSFENFDCWTNWQVFSTDAISRMDEAEAVSEYILAFMEGITAKSQPKIDALYEKYEEEFPAYDSVRQRFDTTVNAIGHTFGDIIGGSAFQRPALFYSFFCAAYHHMFGLKSSWKRSRPKPFPRGVARRLERASDRIRSKELPEKVQDAMDKATGDKARRDERHKFLMGALNLEPGG